MTILQLMEVLSEKSDDSKLEGEFWTESSAYAAELAGRLSVTPKQAVLLSICLRKGPRGVDFDDIARHLDISNIRALSYSDDVSALVRAKYLKYRDAKDEDSFDVPVSVIRALKNNEAPEQPRRTGLNAAELFEFMAGLYDDLDSEALLPGDLYHELKDLFECNKDLNFVRELDGLKLADYSQWMVLVYLCHLLVNRDDDEITYRQIEDVYRHKSDFYEEKTSFRDGTHPLMQQGLVEHVCDDGQVNPSQIHLSDKAKTLLLSDFHLRNTEATVGGRIKPETISGKELFYTAKNAPQVEELSTFLMPDRYAEIRSRMKDSGFRSGFACLFYGAPGTGKTETVYQLARRTGRSIMTVDVPDSAPNRRPSSFSMRPTASLASVRKAHSVQWTRWRTASRTSSSRRWSPSTASSSPPPTSRRTWTPPSSADSCTRSASRGPTRRSARRSGTLCCRR